MILKKLSLQNVRSYKEKTDIEIPEGRTLFQGDIGCGKSTILSAIEFALFGLGDIDGNHILRSGEKTGSVVLEFNVDGKSYQIYRSLKRRGNNVSQDKGYIIDGDVTTSYSTSEMKSKVLQIININEKSQTRTTSVIYRYAIFTPQEMMKQVLAETKERRLEILRRAFSIEEYSTAKKNTGVISTWMDKEIHVVNELTKDLYDKENLLNQEQIRRKFLSEEIKKISHSIAQLNADIEDLNNKLPDLRDKKELVIQLKESIPHLNNAIAKNLNLKEQLRRHLAGLEEHLELIKKSEDILLKLKPSYDDYLTKRQGLLKLEKSVQLYGKLEIEKVKLEQFIENAAQCLKTERSRLDDEIKKDKQKLVNEKEAINSLGSIEQEEHSISEDLKRLPELRKQVTFISTIISEKKVLINTKNELISGKEKEIQQIESIGNGATCPKCKQRLTDEHISKVRYEFEQERQQIEGEIKFLTQQKIDQEKEKKKIEVQIIAIENKEGQLQKLLRRRGELIEKKQNIEDILEKLKGQESDLCRVVDSLQHEEYAIKEREKLSGILKEIKQLSNDKDLYDDVHNLISKYENENIETQYLEKYQEVKRKSEIQNEIEDTVKFIDDIQREISSDSKILLEKQALYNKNKEVISQLEKLEKELGEVGEARSQKQQDLAAKDSELKGMEINLRQLESDIAQKKEYFKNKQIFQQAQNWLDQCFVPAIEDIEKHVLRAINEEFNQHFKTWFNTLIETQDISVEVDENFTPIINQSGYSLDVNSLSGGEKSSVALAYRLALNIMIKKIASMENSLLILDEPTDGFGKEQLIRLREVLDELNRAQIILVSHERELESFVDRIYKVTKEGNISKLQLITS
jgi:DNA repair protein SbcC/Rad50